MPVEIVPIKEVERAISRPIAFDIIRELIPRWRMDPEKVKIVMFGSTESIPTTHSTIHKESKPHRLFNDLNIKIEVDENYVEYGSPYQPYKDKEHHPIFLDAQNRISVRPVYREVQAEINVEITAKSRVHAEQIFKKMQAEMRAYSQYDHHEVEYHYQFQGEIFYILKYLWESMFEAGHLKLSFKDWFNKHIDPRITVNRNHGEKGHQLAIRESQVSIIGYCDFSDPPKPEKSETGMLHNYSFSYKYTYMRPEHLVIYFPIALHNRMIPDNLIDKTRLLDASDFYGKLGWSHHGLIHLSYNNGLEFRHQRSFHVTIPHYDDWKDYRLGTSFDLMLQALLYVNPENPNHVINLKQMGGWKFKERVYNYIKKRKNGNFIPFDSIFFFQLYEWEDIKDYSKLAIDDDLVISFNSPREPTKNYHLIMSLVTDPTRLSKDALRDLLEDGDLVTDYIGILFPGVDTQIGDWNDWIRDRPKGNNPKDTDKKYYKDKDNSFPIDEWNKLMKQYKTALVGNRSRHRVFTNIITYDGADK